MIELVRSKASDPATVRSRRDDGRDDGCHVDDRGRERRRVVLVLVAGASRAGRREREVQVIVWGWQDRRVAPAGRVTGEGMMAATARRGRGVTLPREADVHEIGTRWGDLASPR